MPLCVLTSGRKGMPSAQGIPDDLALEKETGKKSFVITKEMLDNC